MERKVLFAFLCVLGLSLASCSDELFGNGEYIPDGESSVSLSADFRPMSVGLDTKPGRSHGKILNTIERLAVLVYDAGTRELKYHYDVSDFTTTNVGRSDADAAENGSENKKKAESKTLRATFNLQIPYGKYHIYAVANVPDLLTGRLGEIQNIDDLKRLPLTWQGGTDSLLTRLNAQMIGCFMPSDKFTEEVEPLVINRKNMKLQSWLRRAASKLTVSYDGSQLKEGVFVYIKSVQIHDIPTHCYLGKPNNVGLDGYTLGQGEKLLQDGEKICYYKGNEPTVFDQGYEGPRITSGKPLYGSHDEAAQAMYFYENMQGVHPENDKRQDAGGDHKLDHPGLPGDPEYLKKDGVENGTYVEVDAFYVSVNPERLGSGPIKYRFMLGKNVTTDYNAERNHHYKLTMMFKNFANDVDWHIEYNEPEPGVITPEPYYISYLYNHSMKYPVKVNTGGYGIEYMKAVIDTNCWGPNTLEAGAFYDSDPSLTYETPWNGFLSLHKTENTVVTGSRPFVRTSNKNYYEAKPRMRGERTYSDFTIGQHTTAESLSDDLYEVEKADNENNTYNVLLPMYTRAKQLIKATGHTGNNPFKAYQRKATVTITTKLKNIEAPFVNHVTINQVRRIENPKGIFRSWDNNKDFHVVLKRLPSENSTRFVAFPSEGEWRAYVVRSYPSGSDSIITLAATGSMTRLENGVIYGNTGSDIDFNIKFTGKGRANASGYAVVRVEYHNYTCQHLIFVRQGDTPDNIVEGSATKWHAKNMRTKTEEGDSPLDEGSLFRWNNWDQPIDALCNKNPTEDKGGYWTNVKPGDFKKYPKEGLSVIGAGGKKETVQWGSIKVGSTGSPFSTPTGKWRVASINDYAQLYNSPTVEQGFGVLYGDSAVEVMDDINEAYGYDYASSKKRGMRGCFVYNSATGKNLFFPIGASGYGHRKQFRGEDSLSRQNVGLLRYSCGRDRKFSEYDPAGSYSEGVTGAPLFEDIYMRPGAIYWSAEQNGNINLINTDDNTAISETGCCGWDINYFTFDFYPINGWSVSSMQDACLIRCVE